MFTQVLSIGRRVVSQFKTFLEGTDTIKAYIQNFAQKNARKISGLMMASKMLSVVMLLALVPLDTPKVQSQKKQSTIEVKLNQTSPMPVVGKNRQVAIATGESNLNLQQKFAVSKSFSGYTSASQSIERDPAYFRGLYIKAGATYGIPWQLIEAVHYIETGCSDSTSESSGAGAMGPMQFMPGTWRTYGVDANGDGSANITDVNDAVYGAANLLAQGGAAEGDYQSALFNYNHAQWYVNKVLAIARDAGM